MEGVGGVTSDNNQGLWLRTRNGRLTLVARKGNFLDTDPGPAQNLQRIFALSSIQALPNLITTQRRTLTNDGEVLFSAEFYNGPSGLFLSNPVPEPTTATLTAATLALSSLIRRRRLRAAVFKRTQTYDEGSQIETYEFRKVKIAGENAL
jgi:hypothetical protein